MKIVCIIQARLNSTRLPGKVLLPLAGHEMLWHIFQRVSRATKLDLLIISTPYNDTKIYDMKTELKWKITIDNPNVNENDLIARFYETAHYFDSDIIVRLCADNPFVEPAEIDRAVQYYLEQPRIFVSNMHKHSNSAYVDNFGLWEAEPKIYYPDGIGCEVFSMSTLKWMHENIKDPILREHPHQYFHEKHLVDSPFCPSEFARPDLKLDVNTQADYEFVSDIYDHLYPKNPNFHITDVISYLENKSVKQAK